MAIFDLHTHSNCSDGILSPEALVSRAKSKAVDVLALTDHDTISGLAGARKMAGELEIELITGIEFSSQWAGRGVHIVGLNFDERRPELIAAIEGQLRIRSERVVKIAEKMTSLGFEGVLEGARELAGSGSIGRPHIAQYLVDSGQLPNITQAFKKYLGAGKAGDIKYVWPDLEDVVGWVRDAGGVAILAHPAKYKMTRTKLCEMVAAFTDVGGEAMEVISGKQTPDVTRSLVNIANKFNLHASCGSDFHSPGQAWQELGDFGELPDSVKGVWKLWT